MTKEKNVILFIVEGLSDKVTLEAALDDYFTDRPVHYEIVRGDITTQDFPTLSQIKSILGAKVNDFVANNKNKINLTSIEKIVLIVDTDGALIPDNRITANKTIKLKYTETEIITNNVKYIKKRNATKKSILKNLYKIRTIMKKDFYTFFFSRNLEHVIHNKIEDLSDEQKTELSNMFAKNYVDLLTFLNFINDANFAVSGNYKETWEFIAKDTNSLKRFSNFHLAFSGMI